MLELLLCVACYDDDVAFTPKQKRSETKENQRWREDKIRNFSILSVSLEDVFLTSSLPAAFLLVLHYDCEISEDEYFKVSCTLECEDFSAAHCVKARIAWDFIRNLILSSRYVHKYSRELRSFRWIWSCQSTPNSTYLKEFSFGVKRRKIKQDKAEVKD